MRTFAHLVYVFGLVVFSSSVQAFDGNMLMKACNALKKDTGRQIAHEHITCIGYLRGYVDGQQIATYMAADKAKIGEYNRPLKDEELKRHSEYCIPKEADNAEQLGLVVLRYLENNPKDLHIPAGLLVWAALKDAYPCWKR